MKEALKTIVQKSVDFFFKSALGIVLFIVLMLVPVGMLTALLLQKHPSSFTVMITNMAETSGGSGSVIETSKDESFILTNAHICNIIKEGGIVKKEDGTKFMATSFIQSSIHDLCLVQVSADLGTSVKVASSAPKLYEPATITGHPSLLPAILSGGKFGDRKIIEIMTGLRPCTPEEIGKKLEKALICLFLGGMPIIKSYESIVVSAMIMGGSSGSAVLNEKGELSGVVFAGQGKGLSYAFIVPWEYVSQFINNKDPGVRYVKLPTDDEEESVSVTEEASKRLKLKKLCKKDDLNKKQEEACNLFNRDLIWESENGK